MKKYITISREYGSGGRLIGKMVAEQLGYAFYDKEIIDMAAEESGLSAEFIKKTEQNLSSGWLYNLLLGTSYAGTSAAGMGQPVGQGTLPLADQIFNAERKIILELTKEPCVIVGNKDLLNVFIYADIEAKIKRIEEIYKETESCAKKTIIQIDKRRACHYNTFTENIWGDRKNYDMMINSTTAGLEATAKWIVELAKI